MANLIPLRNSVTKTRRWLSGLRAEILTHSRIYLILSIILLGAFLVRVWRIDNLLGFYYDQGRDALVIWDLWHKGKFFLIGPTTGIEGIFRGPWYYWLIAPFYLLGNGNPVWPSVFLAVLSVSSIVLIFVVGEMVGGKVTGFIAAIIASFSYFIVTTSRWLSNPNPMLLISMILVYSLFLVMRGKKIFWISVALMLGLAMQFGSAAEIFYFPAVAIFALWQRKNLPSKKIFIASLIVFFITLLPQIVFDLRHDGVLWGAVKKFLFENPSFGSSTSWLLGTRIPIYYSIFSLKIFPTDSRLITIFAFVALTIFIGNIKQLLKNDRFITLIILFITPLVGMLFFRGNYGVIYDYYFTGYYLIFVLILSTLFASISSQAIGKFVIGTFLLYFLQDNTGILRQYLTSRIDGPTTILFGNQKQAVNWVYQDAGNIPFNVDSYVPPVIPYAYDYLFLWWGKTRYGIVPKEEHVPLLYTLYEVDPPHPERLDAWLARQENIGKVEKEVKFGGITVERRNRLPSYPVTQ